MTATKINSDHLDIFVAKNAIINGLFDIWQRGTSFAAIAGGTFHADRFIYHKSGTMVHTISRDTDVPTVAQTEMKINYSLKIDCTTVDSSIAAGDYCFVGYTIEGYDIKRFIGQPITLSFWVKATKTGIYCFSIRTSNADYHRIAEYTINAANTWEKKTISFTMPDGSTGTWNFINGAGLYLAFTLACGSTYQATKDVWASGNALATSSQVNATDSTDNNFWITAIQFELGSKASVFEFRPIAQELSLCQRYYFSLLGQGIVSIETCGGTGTYNSILITYPSPMAAAPTITIVGTFTKINSGNPTVYYASTDNFVLGVAATGTMPVRVSCISDAASGVTGQAEI